MNPFQPNFCCSKMIRLLNPYTGDQFRVELSGAEREFNELLGSLFQINPSFIKGMCDTYGNYYTISSALKSVYIQSNFNDQFTLVINYPDNRHNRFNSMSYIPNKLPALPNNQLSYNYKYVNTISNVNNHFNNRQRFNREFLPYKEQNDFSFDQFPENFSNEPDQFNGNKNNYNNYRNLMRQLLPFINEENNNDGNFSGDDDDANNPIILYKNLLAKLRNEFSDDQMDILKKLLNMENQSIIKYFMNYEKNRDKNELMKKLYSLTKKYGTNKNKNQSEVSSNYNNYNNNIHQNKKKYKNNDRSSSNYSPKNDMDSSFATSHQNRKTNKSKITLSISSSKRVSSQVNNLNDLISKILKFLKKENQMDMASLLQYDLKNIEDKLKTKDKSEIDEQKEKFLNKNFGITDMKLTDKNKKKIISYYDKFIEKNLIKDLKEEDKKLYKKLVKKNDHILIGYYQRLEDLKDIKNLKDSIESCLKNLKIKPKKKESYSEDEKSESENNESESNSENQIIQQKKCSESSSDVDADSYEQNPNMNDDESNKSIRKDNRIKNSKKKEKKEPEEGTFDLKSYLKEILDNKTINEEEYFILLEGAICKSDKVNSCIESYNDDQDKEELNENLKLIIKNLKKTLSEENNMNTILENADFEDNNVKKLIINKIAQKNNYTESQINNLNKAIDSNNKFLNGAFEVLFLNKDLGEFNDSCQLCLNQGNEQTGNENNNNNTNNNDGAQAANRKNLDLIIETFSAEDKAKALELFKNKQPTLMSILEAYDEDELEENRTLILALLKKNN